MTNNAALYGENKGGAQIIDTTSAGQQQFGALLARQQAQRQLELKQLTDQQAQLKPDGLRNDADRKDFFNQVNDWRNKSIAAINERDPYKKSLAQSQAQQAYMQAQNTVSQSKQQAAKDLAFNQFAMNDATRHQLTDDAVTKGLANAEVGVNDPRLIKEYSSLGRQVDHKKIIDQLDAADQDALKQSPWATPTLKDMTVAGRKATFINNSRTLDPNDRAQMYGQMYDTQRDVKKFFNDVYPQFYSNPNLSPEQQKQAAIGQYIKDSGDVSEYSAPQEKAALAPDRFYEHYNYELAHPKLGTAVSNQPTPAQTLITDMQKGVPGTGEKLLSLVPKGQYGDQKPVIGIDNKTGEHIFTFPAINEPDKKAIAKNVQARADAKTDGNPVDPADLLPEAIVKQPAKTYRLNPNSPSYIADVAAMSKDQNINLTQLNQIESVKGGHGQIQQVKNPPQGKTIPAQTIKSLVGRKGYEGYSEQELIDYYKKQGYHIK